LAAQAQAKPVIKLGEDPGPQRPRADVIQEEKRFRAQHGDVVDTMI